MKVDAGFGPYALLLALTIAATAVDAAAPPPNVNQCKSKWVLNAVRQMDFGGFAIESGSGTISMNNLASLTAIGPINLSTSIPVTTFSASVDNTRDAYCATYGFTLSWNTAPSALVEAGGATISFSNPRVTIPAYGLSNVTLPQTIVADPGNTVPFTITVYGDIGVNYPQTSGLYTSPAFIIDLSQAGTATPVNGTASATSFTPLGIVESVAMDFGTVAGGPLAGNVLLDTAGTRSATGDVQLLAAGPGSPATFQVTGEANQAYSLSFGNGTLANAGGQLISVSGFTDNSLGTIPGSGSETFQVGATLGIGSNQAAGNYSTANGGGSPYTVTINYN
ncbi:MAG: DUF4402 domain-containing protein [Gammaproteobacteria bacterium]|jgi:hypothetical protein